ncbi:J domain-containing protein [Dermatobacter hominis]|uniref:J domain-containing protein n=1 Tax=Dermatobacter hominis TaxID=2884263 RepID=UPI001D107891|nr:J domain-containing protein [Dermatobacter hominis]UDY37163.1 J domain-containing protein [Dermatobacter hominis]
MILAEVEAFHSRPIAPTRRIALGDLDLPCDPAPGFGGILLGGIAARFAGDLDEDTAIDVAHLVNEVERGGRIPQPRARHRLQVDRIGLRPCHHRLVGRGEQLVLDIDHTRGTPAQHVLCAVYAAGTLPPSVRPTVMSAVRKGLRWHGEIGPSLIAHLAGRGADLSVTAAADPVGWALRVLQLDAARTGGAPPALRRVDLTIPSRKEVQQAFRDQLRAVHPDHGAEDDGAAQRISELAEARRILLG